MTYTVPEVLCHFMFAALTPTHKLLLLYAKFTLADLLEDGLHF